MAVGDIGRIERSVNSIEQKSAVNIAQVLLIACWAGSSDNADSRSVGYN